MPEQAAAKESVYGLGAMLANGDAVTYTTLASFDSNNGKID